jgi:hypothetical protein
MVGHSHLRGWDERRQANEKAGRTSDLGRATASIRHSIFVPVE